MKPVCFLLITGSVLVIIGFLGIVGLFGKISPLGFFHPPYWINFVHFALGVIVLVIAFKGNSKLQTRLIAVPAVLATLLGLSGLVFGSYAARTYNIPELADPSDHIAHLAVGLFAISALWNSELNFLKKIKRN